MKKLLLLPLIAISFISTAQTTAIPDANFEQRLIDLGLDNVIDGGVLTANIDTLTSLNVSSVLFISDLTGIEDFTALTYLDCGINQLTSLDVSQNTALTYLNCYANDLTSLDVSQNTALTYLKFDANQITSLDVSQNTALTHLSCFQNHLTSIDVTQNTALTVLNCGGNGLLCLNVKNGNNSNFTSFIAVTNFDLSCIEVDDVAYSTDNWVMIDPASSFSTNCNNPCLPSSINEKTLNTVELYPNPTTSTITLNHLLIGDEVSVYNTLGQRVYSSKVNAVTLSINLSELGNNGIYFVRVDDISERVLLGR